MVTISNFLVNSRRNTAIFAAIPFVFMDAVIRLFAIKVHYFHFLSLIPSIVFTYLWVGLIIHTSLFLKSAIGKTVYSVFFIVYFAVFTTHLIYYPYTGFFFNFSLLNSASEGSSYILDVVKNTDLYIFVILLFTLALGIFTVINLPKRDSNEWKKLGLVVLIFVVARLLTPFLYGSANSGLKWDSWRNPRNVYAQFSDSNKSIKITGLYEYTFRDAYKNLFSTSKQKMTPEDEEFLENAYDDKTVHRENAYTGIFEGKNVIFVQLEGLDSWLLTEEDTPNLYSMLNESFVFSEHYSFYNGGGSTFNSELAAITGFFTPMTYTKNAYLFNDNAFPNSLPRLFRERGYRTNAFHMNTGEFYMRELNYRNWGFDDYCSLIDDSEYSDDSFNLDSELIENEVFYEKMFLGTAPFLHYIITYTPHTPFSLDGDTGAFLAKKLYPDGDYPELDEEGAARLFAGETDRMMGLLMKALEDNGLAENTVIVCFADHYLYTLNDKSILDKYKNTDNNLINKTPFFIWSKGMERVNIDKVNSQIDILPTVLNMFGFDYCNENYIGHDIMSDMYSGYVFFSDYSWYDGVHYVENGEVVNSDEYDPEYIERINDEINLLINKNDMTLKYDFLGEKESE